MCSIMPILILLLKIFTISFAFVLISFAASTKNYELGTVYSYDYTLQLEMSEPTENVPNAAPVSTVGYKIITKVEIQPVWEKGSDSLVQIKVLKITRKNERFLKELNFSWSTLACK